jgi:hypothetical protein
MGAEDARYLTSGHAYVQDERYAAGAGMRRSGQAHPVALDTRRPASYGPGKTIPAPASAMSVLVLFVTITL